MTLADLERLCEQATRAKVWLSIEQALSANPERWQMWGDEGMFKHDLMSRLDTNLAAAREWMPKLIAVAKAAHTWRDLMLSDAGSDEQRTQLDNAAYMVLSDALAALGDAGARMTHRADCVCGRCALDAAQGEKTDG